jgi:glutamate 5-kinase
MAQRGRVLIDEGAFRALTRVEKAGLLPVGVIGVEGTFSRDEAVAITVATRSADGTVIATKDVGRALVNYSATEIERIKGHRSSDILDILGYADGEYIAHRDNLVFMPKVTAELKIQQ